MITAILLIIAKYYQSNLNIQVISWDWRDSCIQLLRTARPTVPPLAPDHLPSDPNLKRSSAVWRPEERGDSPGWRTRRLHLWSRTWCRLRTAEPGKWRGRHRRSCPEWDSLAWPHTPHLSRDKSPRPHNPQSCRSYSWCRRKLPVCHSQLELELFTYLKKKSWQHFFYPNYVTTIKYISI